MSPKHQYDIAYNRLIDSIAELIISNSKEGRNVCQVTFTGEFINYDAVLDHFRNLGYKIFKDDDYKDGKKIRYKIYWGLGVSDYKFDKINPK